MPQRAERSTVDLFEFSGSEPSAARTGPRSWLQSGSRSRARISHATECAFPGTTLRATLPIALGLLFTSAGQAVPQSNVGARYEAILEWNGPYFQPAHAGGVQLETDSPVTEFPFRQPIAVAAREHDDRDVIYVLDSGHHRIQVFEANAILRSLSQSDLVFNAGAPAAGEFSDQFIRPPEFAGAAVRWVIPRSEAIFVDGVEWTRVDDLTGFDADDHVYTVDYGRLTDQPEFEFPAGSLSATSLLEIRYVLTSLQDYGADTPVPGLGELDYGVHAGSTTFTRVQIDETSGGPTQWEAPRALALIPAVTDPTSDLLFIADAADASGPGDEQIFSFEVDAAGNVTPGEQYGDLLSGPYDVAVSHRDAGQGASAWLSADTGPFDRASYPFVIDANQVTGHTYEITVAAGAVTITDITTGRVLVQNGAQANFADPFLGIPGLSLPLNAGPWPDGTTTLRTKRPLPGRYLFIADTGNDRIKVTGLPSGVTAVGSNWSGDWLPLDERVVAAQPSAPGSIGANAAQDYRQRTPASVGEDWIAWTTASPIAENTLETIIFDPDGVAAQWIRVDDITTASPSDSVFEVDWRNGMIRFGDGIHGAVPPPSTEFEYTYAVTPDLVRFGTSGTGNGRFSSPRGISARWNDALARFDVYVADAANHRIQKFAFFPEDSMIHVPARIEHEVSWSRASGASDLLAYPADVVVQEDGGGEVFVVVSDPAHQRIAVYRDTHADTPGSTLAPGFDATLGTLGNRFGNFVTPAGMALLGNGNSLDLYIADESRGVVVKFEEGPTPTITLLFTADSALPACFPPNTGYPIRFTTTHPPLGGWVDFYYDTVPNFNPSTAKLAIAAGSVPATATTAFWDFAKSPGGPPGDGVYYLFARLEDATGSTVAWDETTDHFLLCIDSSLIPSLQARDAIDHDRTLSLQNGLTRDVALQVTFPDSVVSVAVAGTFDPTLVSVVSATPGTAWEGLGYTNLIFNAIIDTLAGRYEVTTTVTDAPVGLRGSGPYDIAFMQVRTKPNAISETQRFRDGVLSVDKARSAMIDVHGLPPAAWTTRSLNLRAGYLGDIARTGVGADSVVPHLQPRPDGRIDFEDQVAFTLGWNGKDFTRDPIADLGPAVGLSPNLWAVPDDDWDIDDIVVFTGQSSFFGAAGWNFLSRPSPQGDAPSSLARSVSRTERWEPVASASGPITVAVRPRIANRYEIEVGVRSDVAIMGARLGLHHGDAVEVVAMESGGFLRGSSGGDELAVPRESADCAELGLTRLSTTEPAIAGAGRLATFTVECAGEEFGELEFELRGWDGKVVATGVLPVTLEGDVAAHPAPTEVRLRVPNPAHPGVRLGFDLPTDLPVKLALYDIQGRLVRVLADEPLRAGSYQREWDGRTESGHPAANGIYFAELRAGSKRITRSLSLTR